MVSVRFMQGRHSRGPRAAAAAVAVGAMLGSLVAPIVLAPASVGDCLHIGVSWRTSAFTRADVDRITASMLAGARALPA